MSAAIEVLPTRINSKATYSAEQDVIACCVRDPERLNRVSLEPKNFTDGPNQRIWESLLALHAEGEPIDAVTVAERLEEAGHSVAIAYLLGCIENGLDTNFEYKASMVFRSSQKTEFWRQIERAYHNRDEAEIVRVGEEIQLRLAEGARRAVQTNVATAFASMVDEWADSRSRPQTTWGLRDLDKHLKPMEPTRLHVVAARPGIGKTAFALNVCLANARAGKKVAYISLEQSMEELTARMLCNLATCPIEWVRGEETPPAPDVRRLDEAKRRLVELPIMINDATPMSIGQLQGWARSLVHRYGCELLVIDYVQKVGGDRAKERHMEVAHVAMGIKNIARQHKIPVLALAQANRNAEGKRPTMADIRDSGFIEQEADQIIALHRDVDAEGDLRNEVELLLLKNRHGEAHKIVRAIYRGQYFRFDDQEHRHVGGVATHHGDMDEARRYP